MCELNELQDVPKFDGGMNGTIGWWLAPDGQLKPCPEHEYAAREILRGLGVVPSPGRKLYHQMFDQGWVRVVMDSRGISFQTACSPFRVNDPQLRALKALAVARGTGLFNITKNEVLPLEGIE